MTHLYSNLKFLRYADRLQKIADKTVAVPVHVRIKPINYCNHNCWYCAYRADQLQLGDGMDTRDRIPRWKMDELVDDLIDMKVQAVTFSGGGEPLIYKPLPEAIEKLAKGGIRVAALSNGSNLKGYMADAFAKYGTWIRISLDGWDGKSYAKSRGIKSDAFDLLIANMRAFAAKKSNCVLGVSFIVSKENHDHLYEVCELMKDVGTNHIKISGAVVSNDVRENNLYHLEIVASVTDQIKKAKRLNSEHFRIVDHFHETEERFKKNYEFCSFLNYLTVVGADLNIYTCQDKAYTEKGLLGSIRERSFKEFWFSDENKRNLYNLNPSKDCQHHCVAHEKNLAIMEFLSLDSDHARFV